MIEVNKRPILAITMGDPVGVGPEIVVQALTGGEVYEFCRPLVLGDRLALEQARGILGLEVDIHLVTEPAEGSYRLGALDLLPLSELSREDLRPGQPTAAGGAAMVSYIITAIELARRGAVAGIVTGPISKQAMHLAGYRYPGHTELLAERSGASEVAMMLAGGNFRVVLATIHCPLAEVAGRLHPDRLVDLFRLTCRALAQDFGLVKPEVGVAALNPHAGEGGLFGGEEAEIIAPAVRRVQGEGLAVYGPYPADTLFWRHQQGEFDAVVCMYHDQGLIPLKLLHFMDAVNVTLGLPIIRTSVDHGTAYELAGKGLANPGSLKAALLMAAQIARRKMVMNR